MSIGGSVQVGLLRSRVNILRRTDETQNARGQYTGEFAAVASGIPARVVELSGRELERAKQIVAEATHQITCRAITQGITPKDRIELSSGTVLTIGSAQTSEFGNEMTLICFEVKR